MRAHQVVAGTVLVLATAGGPRCVWFCRADSSPYVHDAGHHDDYGRADHHDDYRCAIRQDGLCSTACYAHGLCGAPCACADRMQFPGCPCACPTTRFMLDRIQAVRSRGMLRPIIVALARSMPIVP